MSETPEVETFSDLTARREWWDSLSALERAQAINRVAARVMNDVLDEFGVAVPATVALAVAVANAAEAGGVSLIALLDTVQDAYNDARNRSLTLEPKS